MENIDVNTVGGGDFDQVVESAAPAVRQIAIAARELIAEVMPGVTEVPWVTQKTVGYGVGPKKMSEHFCYVAPHKEHVNLGFLYGADLDDPERQLEGTGKALRHVKLRSLEDVHQASIRRLVESASQHLPKLSK